MIDQPSLYESPKAKLAFHLLDFIKSKMIDEINKCKKTSDKHTPTGERQVNIAGFCVKFLDDITKERESYEQLQVQKGNNVQTDHS